MLFGCVQPFLWGERCVTSQKTAAKETTYFRPCHDFRRHFESRQGSQKLQCLYSNPMANNFFQILTLPTRQSGVENRDKTYSSVLLILLIIKFLMVAVRAKTESC